MVTLPQVHASNASLASRHPEFVAVFVGGTSGIGEFTSKELATAVPKPTIYLVGRNEVSGSRILRHLQAANPQGSFHFIQSDVSRLRNVDDVCRQIQAKEKEVNLLFLSTGYLSMTKKDTDEGLEENHSLRYYSRFRFIHNLLPQLSASRSPARVISVLAAGQEGPIAEDNFDLKKYWSFLTAGQYAATLNSLAMEHLATQNPSISFLHVFPGIVQTPLMNKTFGGVLGPVLQFLSTPFAQSPQENAQRNLFLATSAMYPPAKAKDEANIGVPVPEGLGTCTGSTGEKGGGSYVLSHTGRDVTKQKVMTDLREKQFPEKVWEHTLETFQRILDPA